jgi:hypothetical protein
MSLRPISSIWRLLISSGQTSRSNLRPTRAKWRCLPRQPHKIDRFENSTTDREATLVSDGGPKVQSVQKFIIAPMRMRLQARRKRPSPRGSAGLWVKLPRSAEANISSARAEGFDPID